MNRVWVYQADRLLTAVEVETVEHALTDFVSTWTAHGSALAGSAFVRENLFVILEVDETKAGITGCSIDKSVHFLKVLGQKLGLDFFNRMKISFRDHNNQLNLVDRAQFEALIQCGEVNQETIVFNNLVQNADQLAKEWQIPFKDSWHNQVF